MRRRRLLQAGLALAGGSWAAARAALPTAQPAVPQPAPLRRGSRIAALAPGTWLDPADPLLDQLNQRCAAEGWQLLRPTSLSQRWRWFAGSDRQRLGALQQAWLDPRVDALFYVGAGWGSARVLEAGWRFPASPRWCVGFSDCSALLLAQWAAGSAGGVHGWFGSDAAAWQRLVALLQHRPVAPLQGATVQGGVARGSPPVSKPTTATSLIGTPWLPPRKGAFRGREVPGAHPYCLDRHRH